MESENNKFSMSAQTIPDYLWKLFQMIALKLLGKLFVLPVGPCSFDVCNLVTLLIYYFLIILVFRLG